MSWVNNPIMEWSVDGVNWTKISDHGRGPLNMSVERIETKNRMANATLRRYVVNKKRTWSTSWENLPDKEVSFLANGRAGNWMENFHDTVDGEFYMRLRAGSDRNTTTPLLDASQEFVVMISDFSKEVTKRGISFDLWSLDVTLEEV